MAEVVRISVPAGSVWAEVTCYEARRFVSSLPRPLRRWDANRKVWLVDVSLISRLASDMRRAGFEVLVDDELDQAPDSWADGMYEVLGPELGDGATSC